MKLKLFTSSARGAKSAAVAIPSPRRAPKQRGMSWALRRRFYEQASSQLDNGRKLTEILKAFAVSVEGRGGFGARTRAAGVRQILRAYENGEALADAMRHDLSNLERGVLTAGEHAGQLSQSMRLIVEVKDMTDRLRNKLASIFVSPLVYVLALVAVMYTLAAKVVPVLGDIVPTSKWTGWAKVLYVMTSVTTSWYAVVLVLALLLVSGAIWLSITRWVGTRVRGRAFCDRYVLPFIVYREIAGFTWLISFSALLRAGVATDAAVAGQMRTATPWLRSRLVPALVGIRNGQRLDTSLKRSGNGFPSLELIEEIGAYVDYSDFAERMDGVLKKYVSRLERRMVLQGTILGTLFSGLIYLMMVAVQLGANDISSLVSTTANAVN